MADQDRPEQSGNERASETGSPRQQPSEPRGGAASAGGMSGGAFGNRQRERGRRHRDAPPQPRRPEAVINMEELRELFTLITAQGFTEFELEKEGFRVKLRRDAAAATTQTTQESPVSSSTAPPTSPQSAGATVSGQAAPAVATTTTPPATANAPATETAAGVGATGTEEELQIITSPIVGTFYRAPSANSEPFVRAGSHVEPDTVVCIIEAMKLMNEIQSEIAGVVEKIYVENGQPVEYGQSLFGIKK